MNTDVKQALAQYHAAVAAAEAHQERLQAKRILAAQTVRDWRAARGLTQSSCAARWYVSERTWQRWEAGECRIPGSVLAQLHKDNQTEGTP